jgi:acetoin utilization deacetylase AcuC-like enzyme
MAARDATRAEALPVLTVYSDDHALQDGKAELIDGQLLPCFEMPRRAFLVRDRVLEVGLGEVVPPEDLGRAPIERVHDASFVEFLATHWERWTATGREHDALPWVWPVRHLRQDARPERIDALMGHHSFDAGTPLTAGTWRAAYASAQVALTGARLIAGGGCRAAFSLCRPPGHHAARDLYGGYCFLNNAAIAAQHLVDGGAERVAILDVDYHHGNGTQAIFYDRADVLVVSLHGHPAEEYPFYLGWADETGAGEGEGFNANYPLRHGTGFPAWREALEDGLRRVADHGPDVLIVSLGVDTYKHDPISRFVLESENFATYGGMVARLGLPTLFVMEGGYAVERIGVNAVNVLTGFEGRG